MFKFSHFEGTIRTYTPLLLRTFSLVKAWEVVISLSFEMNKEADGTPCILHDFRATASDHDVTIPIVDDAVLDKMLDEVPSLLCSVNFSFSDTNDMTPAFMITSFRANCKDWPRDRSAIFYDLILTNVQTNLETTLKVTADTSGGGYTFEQLGTVVPKPKDDSPLGDFIAGVFARSEAASAQVTQDILKSIQIRAKQTP